MPLSSKAVNQRAAVFGFFNGYILLPLLERVSGRDVFSKRTELETFEALTNQEQLVVQREQVCKLLFYCNANIAYYRDLFAKHLGDIEKVRKDLRYLRDLPLLTKELVREHGSGIRRSDAHHVRKTGGSTGSSAFFYYDNVGMDWTAAINMMAYQMAGKMRHHRECHISAELNLYPPNLKGRLLDRIGLMGHNRQRLMIDSFCDQSLELVYKNLRKIRPFLLQGHPSSAYALANFIHRKKLAVRPLCRVFEPSGEALNEKMVFQIQTYLGCKVVNRYGNAEFGVVAHSRSEHSYRKLKVFRRGFYVEECEESPLIVTNLTNYGFPLIRYDTGDLATVKEEPDGCYIYDIQGRVHDTIKIQNDLFPTHFIMDFLDHRVKGVREFQVLISRDKNPQLRIVPERREDCDRILRLVLSRWPQGLEVEFIDYDQLQTVGWRQKFRHVIDQGIQNEASL